MAYQATTPWEWQTWGANEGWPDKYSRLAARPVTGGTYQGEINPYITDVARGVTLIAKDGLVEATLYPYQNTLEDADFYILGGHTQVITDEQAAVLIANGYEDYVEPII